jgi:hypothetical protein
MLNQKRVWTFFYGSFMNRAVCAEAGADLGEVEVARLAGRELRIGPLATLLPSPRGVAYGLLACMSHAELERLYGLAWVGRYVPEPVIVETAAGRTCAALVYVKYDVAYAPAAPDYVDRILAPARQHGFPDWYLEHVERFRGPVGR